MKLSEKQALELIAFLKSTLRHNGLIGNWSWETRRVVFKELVEQQSTKLVELSSKPTELSTKPAKSSGGGNKPSTKNLNLCISCAVKTGFCLGSISDSNGTCEKCGRKNAIVYTCEE